MNTGGTLTPGDGILPGTLTATGPVTFNADSTFGVNLASTSSFDQLIAAGASLNDATLALIVGNGFSAPVNTTFTVISNSTGAAVSGTFKGLTEGTVFNVGCVQVQDQLRRGTNSNNVALTYLGRTLTWTGGGVDSHFSDAANWQGGLVPTVGDTLVFPANAGQYTVSNDLDAGVEFNAMRSTAPAMA